MTNLENIEPGQWVVLRGCGRFAPYWWEKGRLEIDGFAAGPVEKLTAHFVFTSEDVLYSKRHSRGDVVAIVSDWESAKVLLLAVQQQNDELADTVAPLNAKIETLKSANKTRVEKILKDATL